MSTPLFASSPVYVEGLPTQSGFYEIEWPDGFRWMQKEASCFLPTEALEKKSIPVIRVTANAPNNQENMFLSLELNSHELGTQCIDHYGAYYFQLKKPPFNSSQSLKIHLKLDRKANIPNDSRPLGIPIYGIDILDLDSGWNGFDERAYLANQIQVFQANESILRSVLQGLHLHSESKILDIGAGQGWTSVILAALSGAKVFAIDLYQYDKPLATSFKWELVSRFKRHLSVLQKEPGLEHIHNIDEIISRCNFYTMDAEEMLFKDNLFDFIFSLNAFEHIPCPSRALHEISRVLKPGGQAFLSLNPIYHADVGHHLMDLIDIPWVHLLYDRQEIKARVGASGKPVNEVDNILNSLNGYSVRDYIGALSGLDLEIQHLETHKLDFKHAIKCKEFKILKKTYTEEELLTRGITALLAKH